MPLSDEPAGGSRRGSHPSHATASHLGPPLGCTLPPGTDVRYLVAEHLSKIVAQMVLESTSSTAANASLVPPPPTPPTPSPPPPFPPLATTITPTSGLTCTASHGLVTSAASLQPASPSFPEPAGLEHVRRTSLSSSKQDIENPPNVLSNPREETGEDTGANAAKLEYLGQLASLQLRCLGAKCEHVSCWKRMRAKKGRAYYVCQQCGVRWSSNSGGRASTEDMYANEMRSLMAIADSVNEEAQKLLGSSVTSLTESIAASSSSGEVDLLGVSVGSSHLTLGSGSTHCISVLESKTSSACTSALTGVVTCSESNRGPSSSEQRRPSDGCAEGESVPTACWHLPSFLLQQLAQPSSVSEGSSADNPGTLPATPPPDAR